MTSNTEATTDDHLKLKFLVDYTVKRGPQSKGISAVTCRCEYVHLYLLFM